MSSGSYRVVRSERLPWLEVRVAGRGDPPLLAVPPAVGHVETVWPVIAPLAARRRVVSFSLRGEAGHDVAPDFGWDDLVADLDEVHEVAGIGRSVLFGTSFGGSLVLRYALERPTRAAALVLNVTTARMRHLEGLRPLFCRLDEGAPEVAGRLVNGYSLIACAPEVAVLGPRRALEAWARMRGQVERLPTPRPTLGRRIRLMMEQDLEDRLAEIRCPTLVLSGEDWLDLLVPRSIQRPLVAEIPGAAHAVVEGTGHLGIVTAPDSVRRRLLTHLERLDEIRPSRSAERGTRGRRRA